MSIGDLIFQMMGQQDPRKQLLAAAAGQQQPQQQQAAADGAPPQGQQQQPVQQKQPEVFQSPPQLMDLYVKLQQREEANRGIDLGMALIGSAFAKPQNRDRIMQAFAPQADTSGRDMSTIGNIMKIQENQQAIQRKAVQRQNLPAIAQKYGLSLDAAQYLFDSGKLDDIIANAEKPENASPAIKNYEYYSQQEKAAGREPKPFAEFQLAASGQAHQPPAKVQEYNFYADQETKAGRTPKSFDEWSQKEGKFGNTLTYGQDADGNTVLLQPSSAGGVQQIQLPQGVKVGKDPIRVDAGTKIILLDPVTRQVIGEIPKDVQGEAAAKATGATQAAATDALPGAETSATNNLALIDSIQSNPAYNENIIGGALGMPGLINRNIPATEAFGLNERIKQLQGQSFLQAYTALKGTGSISEIEGKKAEQAISRLNAAQSKKDFDEALSELKAITKTGLDNMKRRAGGGATAPGQAKVRKYNPQTGKFE